MESVWLGALGAVGVFLLGMVSLERGLEGLAGTRFKAALARSTRTPLTGALAGAGITALVQSSSVTTLTTVALVGAGVVTFPQALGVVLGANVGTTVKGWLVSLLGFEVGMGGTSGLLVFAGVLVHLFARGRAREAGLALAGFGLVFLGLDLLAGALAGLEGVVTPASLPGDGLGGRALLVLIGLAITLVTQSSSAGVAAALAGLHTGTIELPQAGALVIGMDLGTTGTALLAAVGGTTAARRTGVSHVVFNVFTAVGAFFLLDLYLLAVEGLAANWTAEHPEVALVGFHTLFNLLSVVIALPFARPLGRLVERMVPEREERLTRGLEPRLARTPELALDAAARVLHRVARKALREALRTIDPRTRRGRHGPDLARLGRAVDEVTDFLARVPADRERAEGFSRETALVHQADHLTRLLARLSEVPAAVDERQGEAFEGHRTALVQALSATLRSGAPGAGWFEPEALRRACEDLERADESLRSETIASAGRDELTPDEALSRLDRLRWVRRVAHHAWRIAHHSRRAWGAPDGSASYAPSDAHEPA